MLTFKHCPNEEGGQGGTPPKLFALFLMSNTLQKNSKIVLKSHNICQVLGNFKRTKLHKVWGGANLGNASLSDGRSSITLLFTFLFYKCVLPQILRSLRHLRQICRQRSFFRQKMMFLAFLLI